MDKFYDPRLRSLGVQRNLVRSIRWVAIALQIGVYAWMSAPIVAVAQVDPVPADSAKSLENPYPLRVAAPGLEGGDWVNVAKPLSLTEFRGRFVLLDFWTYCCINCMHVLPELKKLERAYPHELVVIGVHSAKFAGEQLSDNIREAATRYEIEHPIVNDAQMTIWRRYGARSWPTLVLIDPAGEVVWAASGERTFDDIKPVIDRGLPFYRQTGILKPAPRPTLVDARSPNTSGLKFPGKVLADAATDRIFIADSNHNRIIVASLAGKVQHVIGTGEIGRVDGPFNICRFDHPQGLALVGNKLYVADTENHLLRRIDLDTRRSTTIAGTGTQGHAWIDNGPREADSRPVAPIGRASLPLSRSLSSPWALWRHDKDLFIAMAGMHQLWKMPLDESGVAPYAGSGRENVTDGPLLPATPFDPSTAAFAQPSGLASDGGQLFVADSEGSTIRVVPLDGQGNVQTLVGLTNTLFDFGDVDGTGEQVRLQHPLGVAWAEGKLYVADTYNNKIKVIDVARRSCQSIAGTGRPGNVDAGIGREAAFNEPAGLAAAAGKLYVADTNNHAIRIVELAPPHPVSTFQLEGLTPPNK